MAANYGRVDYFCETAPRTQEPSASINIFLLVCIWSFPAHKLAGLEIILATASFIPESKVSVFRMWSKDPVLVSSGPRFLHNHLALEVKNQHPKWRDLIHGAISKEKCAMKGYPLPSNLMLSTVSMLTP